MRSEKPMNERKPPGRDAPERKKKSSYYRRFQGNKTGHEPEAFSSSSRYDPGGTAEPGRLHFTEEETAGATIPEPEAAANTTHEPVPGAAHKAGPAERAARTSEDKTGKDRPGNKKFHFSDKELRDEGGGTSDAGSDGTATGPEPDKRQQRQTDRARAKADHKGEQLRQARGDLPTRRRVRLHQEFDVESGKSRHKLRFENELRPQGRKSKVAGAALTAGRAVDLKAHQKMREVEKENVGVEAAHKAEFTAEQLATRQISAAYRRHKNAPYEKVRKLERQAEKAHVDFLYQQALWEHPEAASNPLSRFQQKRRIKQQYAKELRRAKKQAENAAAGTKKATDMIGSVVQFIQSFVTEHKGALLWIGGFLLFFVLIASLFSSCSVLFENGAGAILSGTYTAEDADILGADSDYSQLETDLRNKIANIERTHPGYDEYRYNVDEINHNPHELISYLTVQYEDFTRAEVQSALAALFEKQYTLTLTEEVEIRYRTETSTDPETGETTSEEVPYEYYILNVTLKNKGLGAVILPELTAEEKERYLLLLQARGLKPHLFGDDIYANPSEGDSYQVPGEALSDPSFAALIAEAEKYLGYPYVWGGSSPSTSFDCSGFVCWVYTASGVHNLPRTTAQGIYNQCARVSPSDAKPGDIIFFTGTYASSGPVSHVGIYVGNGMMIHCGSPIQYANINSSYWQQHFYAFGRL